MSESINCYNEKCLSNNISKNFDIRENNYGPEARKIDGKRQATNIQLTAYHRR